MKLAQRVSEPGKRGRHGAGGLEGHPAIVRGTPGTGQPPESGSVITTVTAQSVRGVERTIIGRASPAVDGGERSRVERQPVGQDHDYRAAAQGRVRSRYARQPDARVPGWEGTRVID